MHTDIPQDAAAQPGGGTDEPAAAAEPIEQPVDVDPVAAARRVLAEAEKQQREACSAAIAEVLGRYGMDLQVTPAQIVIVRRPGPQ